MRFRVDLAYDGTDYQGFQRQHGAVPTIQASVEAALTGIAGTAITIVGAGRTDAGVHAEGQVIAFDMLWQHSPGDLQRALNHYLAGDIVARQVTQVAQSFHPRYDAKSRTYRYRLYCDSVRNVFKDRWLLRVTKPLDSFGISQAVSYLAGTHDFSAFGTPPQGDNPVRTVFDAVWDMDAARQEYQFIITADAFLFRMVRRIVGTLLWIGTGRMTPSDFGAILKSADLSGAAQPAPPCGLSLLSVQFD